MGEVYKAKDSRLDRFVAIKVLPEHLTESPDALARFEREAKAVAALNHPNILGIFDIGVHEHSSYAVMELLEGESFVPTEAVQVGQVHHTERGMILGTIGYMSPEQVRGETVGPRSDLFSFGAVFFEMLTGKRAFERETTSDTLAAILRDEPPEIENVSGHAISLGLRRILDHCLEKDSEHRFHDAQDLAFALESASTTSSDSSASFTAPFAPPNRPTTRKWAALMAALILGAGLAGWAFRGRFGTGSPTALVAVRYLTYSGRDAARRQPRWPDHCFQLEPRWPGAHLAEAAPRGGGARWPSRPGRTISPASRLMGPPCFSSAAKAP